MKKKIYISLGIITGIGLLFLPMLLLTIFCLGVHYLKLENSFSRICWSYFHFASIYGLHLLSQFIAISCKVNGYGLKGKYQNHFIYAFSILSIFLFSYYYSYQNEDVQKIIKLNNAVTIFFIMIIPFVLGLYKGIEEESKMTEEEKQKYIVNH